MPNGRPNIILVYSGSENFNPDNYDLIIEDGVENNVIFCRLKSRDVGLITALRDAFPVRSMGNKDGRHFVRFVEIDIDAVMSSLQYHLFLQNANIFVRTDYHP